MTHGRCTDQKAPFGRFNPLQRRGSNSCQDRTLTHLMMTLQGSRTDLNSLLRIQAECLAAVNRHETMVKTTD